MFQILNLRPPFGWGDFRSNGKEEWGENSRENAKEEEKGRRF